MITEDQEKILALYASENYADVTLAETLENGTGIDLSHIWQTLNEVLDLMNSSNSRSKDALARLRNQTEIIIRAPFADFHFSEDFVALFCKLETLTVKSRHREKISFSSAFANMPSLKSLYWQGDADMDNSIKYCVALETLKIEAFPDEVFSNLMSIGEGIGTLKKLRVLEIDACAYLPQLPDNIGDLENLEELNLNACHALEKLPTSIGKLKNLKRLTLRNLRLKRLPDTFGNLQELETLHLEYLHKLTQLPASFANLYSLKSIFIGYCEGFKKFPENLCFLPSVLFLDMRLSVPQIPAAIGKMQSLTILKIDCSTLVEIDDALCDLVNLEQLIIYSRNPKRYLQLPNQWQKMQKLHDLHFSIKKTKGTLPDTIGLLPNVTSVSFYECGLTQFPPDLSGWEKKLVQLFFNFNQLTEIPVSIGTLSHLKILEAIGNQLQKLPNEIGQLTQLKKLNLMNNQLTTVPDSICHCKNLEELNLEGNPITAVPDCLVSTNTRQRHYRVGDGRRF